MHATLLETKGGITDSVSACAAFSNALDCLAESADHGVNLKTNIVPEQWQSISPDELRYEKLKEIVGRNPDGRALESIPWLYDPIDHSPLDGI
jgi:hypothetical protein